MVSVTRQREKIQTFFAQSVHMYQSVLDSQRWLLIAVIIFLSQSFFKLRLTGKMEIIKTIFFCQNWTHYKQDKLWCTERDKKGPTIQCHFATNDDWKS